MSAISNLIEKQNRNTMAGLEMAIVQLWCADIEFQKLANIAAADLEAKNAEIDLCMERIARLDAIIHAARHGEYDNAHEINAIRKFLSDSMDEYNTWLKAKR